MRNFINIVESSQPPKPKKSDMLDAIQHAVSFGKPFKLSDFKLQYEGYLSVDDIEDFDDISGWLESYEPDDMETYRDGSFKGEAREMPPIIVITYPDEDGCMTCVGDGRGRINFANAHDIKLHVWHMIHKNCKD